MKKEYKELSVYPKHIAFIMDGNGRWAKKRLMPRTFGHKNGCEAIIKVLRACREFNINYVSLYAFSTENWKRDKEEVSYLMELIDEYFTRYQNKFDEHNVKVIVSGFLSVALAVMVGYVLFGKLVPEGDKIGGIMSGMYTGGMLNASAIQLIFKVEEQNYVMMCSYDIVISFLYLVFLVAVGYKMFRRLYGESSQATLSESDKAELERQIAQSKLNPYRGLWSKSGMVELAKIVGFTIAAVALAAASTLLFDESWFMVVLILVLSTLGVAFSFLKPVRELKRSFDIGMYLIYIFSIAMASMADFSQLKLADGLNQILFLTITVFGSLLLHAIFCRVMRVDADSMTVSSVSFINSPPFVPMMVAVLKNRKTLIVGLGAGIVGYALGNHFGVLMASLLASL